MDSGKNKVALAEEVDLDNRISHQMNLKYDIGERSESSRLAYMAVASSPFQIITLTDLKTEGSESLSWALRRNSATYYVSFHGFQLDEELAAAVRAVSGMTSLTSISISDCEEHVGDQTVSVLRELMEGSSICLCSLLGNNPQLNSLKAAGGGHKYHWPK